MIKNKLPRKVILDTSVIIKKELDREFEKLDGTERKILSSLDRGVITPHVLTEFSNHVKKRLAAPKFTQEHKREFIAALDEKNISKEEILESEALKFGVADAALAILAKDTNALLLTYDWALANWCRKNQISAAHVHEVAFQL